MIESSVAGFGVLVVGSKSTKIPCGDAGSGTL
jgi:hypothetical protein